MSEDDTPDPAVPGAPPEDVAGAARPAVYGGRAARGMLWMVLSVGVGKSASFVGQFVLGWIFGAEEFGLYALAIAAAAALMAFKSALIPILVQRGSEYASIAHPVFKLALGLFLLLGAGFAASAGPISAFFDEPDLVPLIWVVAVAIPLNTPGMMAEARLSIDLRFREVARIRSISAVLRHASMITFALLGMGELAFVLPLLVVGMYENVAGLALAGWWPRRGRLTRELLRGLAGPFAWLLLGTLSVNMSMQGDKLVIGTVAKDVLGTYFFGFLLTASISTLFTAGILTVLMPSYRRLAGDVPRQRAAFLNTLRTLTFVSAPACVGFALIAAPLVHVLWRGKWDAATPVVVLLTLSLVFRLVTPVANAVMQAQGRWRRYGLGVLGDAIGTMTAAGIGAATGGLIGVAAWVAGFRMLIGLIHGTMAGGLIGVSPVRLVGCMLAPLAAAGALGGAAWAAVSAATPAGTPWHGAIVNPWVTLLVLGGAYAAAYAAVAALAMRPILDALRRRLLPAAGRG